MSYMSWGGSVALSIPDPARLDRDKAINAFRVLWKDGAERVLEAVPKTGEETGATFSGTSEDYAAFEKLIPGSGVKIELLLEAPTKAQVELMSEQP